MGQEFSEGSAGQFASDPCVVSWGGWARKIHFQDGCIIYSPGPSVLLGFSLSIQNRIQYISACYRLLLRWRSWGRWVFLYDGWIPQSIQFKSPGQKLQVFYWLSFRNPITSLLSHSIFKLVSKASPDSGRRGITSQWEALSRICSCPEPMAWPHL